MLTTMTELYTDESPGLKVDPFVVVSLAIGFIISVVVLHGMSIITSLLPPVTTSPDIASTVLAKLSKRFYA